MPDVLYDLNKIKTLKGDYNNQRGAFISSCHNICREFVPMAFSVEGVDYDNRQNVANYDYPCFDIEPDVGRVTISWIEPERLYAALKKRRVCVEQKIDVIPGDKRFSRNQMGYNDYTRKYVVATIQNASELKKLREAMSEVRPLHFSRQP